MSISVSQAFKRTSGNAIDETLTLTKAEMLAVNDNLMPSKYLTVCQDDGYIYLYDKSATPDAQTGKFSKFEGGGSGAGSENDYSTSEKAIGTWVDGSTLYQKTYIGTTSSSGSSTTVDSSFTYKIKRFFGALSYNSTSINNGGNIVMIGYGIDSNEGRLYAYTYNNKLYLWGSSSSYNFNNRGYALTIQYTK